MSPKTAVNAVPDLTLDALSRLVPAARSEIFGRHHYVRNSDLEASRAALEIKNRVDYATSNRRSQKSTYTI